MLFATRNCCHLCLFVANHGINITETCPKLKSSSESNGIFITGDITCQLSPNVTSLVFVDNLINYLHIFISAICGKMPECSKSTKVFMFEPRKPLKAALSISCVSDAFLPAFYAKLNANVLHLQAIQKTMYHTYNALQ
jgi:hypothetical protein